MVTMKKKAYTQPLMETITLANIAIGDNPADNLVREFEFDNEFDFGDDDVDGYIE